MRIIIISALAAAIVTLPAIAQGKQLVTGGCACKKGSSVLFTANATICTTADHAGCTAAKQSCVAQHGARCRTQGGIISQSGASCTYGAKC